MERSHRATQLTVAFLVSLATLAVAETRKEYRFNVGAKSSISIVNPYGGVSVHPSTGNYILVNATTYSDKVEVDQSQNGNRVDVQSHLLAGATVENSRVDYEILVPADASVTMDGPVTLSNIRDGHVEIDSVSGDVSMQAVTGPLVRVSSTSGNIRYDGDFGYAGEYRFNSHSGDIDAAIPDDASIDVRAQSVRGRVQDDVPMQPKTHTSFIVREGSSFAGTINQAASSVWLRTFSGKIHLKKR